METAARYFETIEILMTEVSRLTKELQDAIKGKLPSRIVPQEEVEKCFAKIAEVIGPMATGSLYSEIGVLCNEFRAIANEYTTVASKFVELDKERNIVQQIIKGDDLDETQTQTTVTKDVARLRGVLELTKMRLDRLTNNSEVAEIRKDLTLFLNGENTNV